MKNIMLGSAVVMLLISSSCKKETDNHHSPSPSNSYAAENYMPLKKGNYWIYEYVNQDSSWSSFYQYIDSVVVEEDTLIDLIPYAKLSTYYVWPSGQTELRFNQFLTIQNNQLVNHEGNIYFDVKSTNEILNTRVNTFDNQGDTDTIYTYFDYMLAEKANYQSPAGVYQCLQKEAEYTVYPPFNRDIANPRYTHVYYAPHVGLVAETMFYTAQEIPFHKRLVRYHVK